MQIIRNPQRTPSGKLSNPGWNKDRNRGGRCLLQLLWLAITLCSLEMHHGVHHCLYLMPATFRNHFCDATVKITIKCQRQIAHMMKHEITMEGHFPNWKRPTVVPILKKFSVNISNWPQLLPNTLYANISTWVSKSFYEVAKKTPQ
jgi:hypothetical protein